MSRNSEKHEKWEICTVGPGLWQEISQTRKRETHMLGLWNMARNTEKVEKWETDTVRPGI